MEDLKVLGTSKHGEEHEIIKSQGTIGNFHHVSQHWTRKCMSFDDGKQKLAEQQEQIEDFREPLDAWEPTVTTKGFALRRKIDGSEYIPTNHALTLMCNVGRGMSDWALRSLREPIRHLTKTDDDGEKIPLFSRTVADLSVMKDYVNIHLFNNERVDQKKKRLFRTWKDGTLRAFLSEQYAIINNGWYLDLLSKLIPGGLLSHWRGDADSIFGNVLVPDTIRQENDSDYGGMLSVGNSEIGLRRISSCPSVFRAICMNGCIWEQEKGIGINIIHRGRVNFTELAERIKQNLEAQIPLLPQGIQRVLGLRAFGVGDTPLPNMFAQLSIDYSLNKRETNRVWEQYAVEVNEIGPTEGNTAFGLMGAITRYGQALPPEGWVRMDRIGGEIANLNRDTWDRFRHRATNLTATQIEKRLGVAV